MLAGISQQHGRIRETAPAGAGMVMARLAASNKATDATRRVRKPPAASYTAPISA